jgi:prepilin-type N-terminal cleavage/methylation domain-containing protein
MRHIVVKNKGFTLIELLVVVAIIGVLSSVVLASLNTARIKAEGTAFGESLRQVNYAMKLYMDGNNDQVPSTESTAINYSDDPDFFKLTLQPMVAGHFIASIPKLSPSRFSSGHLELQYKSNNEDPSIGEIDTEYSTCNGTRINRYAFIVYINADSIDDINQNDVKFLEASGLPKLYRHYSLDGGATYVDVHENAPGGPYEMYCLTSL